MITKDFINRLKKGDPGSFRLLVSTFSGRVYNTALGLVQRQEDAEDITQEVFIEVFQTIPGFREESKLSTWIYRITVSKSLELLRKQNRAKRKGTIQSLFGIENQINVSGKEPFFHPGINLEKKEMAAALFTALQKLPLSQRTAYTLHKLDGLKYSELAEVMGISLSAVESHIFRANRKLKELLRVYYENNLM